MKPEAPEKQQAKRELDEALRVRYMSPRERSAWLRDVWNPLQAQGSALLAGLSVEHGARCFASFAEKNRYDEDRELALAVQLQTKKTSREEDIPDRKRLMRLRQALDGPATPAETDE